MTAYIAVYRDGGTAVAVAEELRRTHDAAPVTDATTLDVRVAEPDDARASIEAEMGAEVAEGWASGLYGFMTAEMMRGAVVFGLLGAAAGIVLGLPLGVLLYDDSASTVARLGIGALIGALFGGTVGTMLGGGMAMKSPEEALAGERGVPVRIDDPPAGLEPEIEAVLARHDPIRVDRFEDGQRVATPVTEAPDGLAETMGEFVANAQDPRRR